uniref:Ammonium transporter AmtB-like domain-containing protein n=1 Tax=Panagrolaimus sp. JU765 TaxID=591449 RepID=A0AC34QB03_9BILA
MPLVVSTCSTSKAQLWQAASPLALLPTSLSDAFGRFNMLHIQSSTLAGGIAIGTVANVILYPHHAIIVGALTGIISVVGHVAITPKFFERKLKLADTCGVHNLHGLPGLLAGILSVFFVLWYDPELYGPRIGKIYPYWKGGERGGDRDQYSQALFQLSGIVITILGAIISGLFTGFVVRCRIWNQVPNQISWEDTNYYKDAQFTLFGKHMENHRFAGDVENIRHSLVLQECTTMLQNGQSIF